MSLNVLGKNRSSLNNFSQNILGNGITDTISLKPEGANEYQSAVFFKYFKVCTIYAPDIGIPWEKLQCYIVEFALT